MPHSSTKLAICEIVGAEQCLIACHDLPPPMLRGWLQQLVFASKFHTKRMQAHATCPKVENHVSLFHEFVLMSIQACFANLN